MKNNNVISLRKIYVTLVCTIIASCVLFGQTALIVDHHRTGITSVPQNWIDSAKAKLHIAYGHTSHGSQITDGMDGLVGFSNGHGKGLALPENIFAWNNGGTDGALDLHDYAMGGDVGYYPDWVNNTKEYLDDAAHADVNVIIWSWCGQVSGKYANGTLTSEYLAPMTQLENDYPQVKFIYMTGHLDHWDDENNKAANEQIRDYCRENGKVLFDFADIESYNPDGVYFPYASDDCSYYESSGTLMGNWAEEWRAAHVENVDWYDCGSAHSDPLNANQKAYAAWHLWASLAGWSPVTSVKEEAEGAPKGFMFMQNYPNPFNPSTEIRYQTSEIGHVSLKVHDAIGREVATLVNEVKEAGTYTVPLIASHLSSGIYFARLQSAGKQMLKKMLLVK